MNPFLTKRPLPPRRGAGPDGSGAPALRAGRVTHPRRRPPTPGRPSSRAGAGQRALTGARSLHSQFFQSSARTWRAAGPMPVALGGCRQHRPYTRGAARPAHRSTPTTVRDANEGGPAEAAHVSAAVQWGLGDRRWLPPHSHLPQHTAGRAPWGGSALTLSTDPGA